MHSDWFISRALFSHNAHSRLKAFKNKVKSHIISTSLTLNIGSLWENLVFWSCCIDLAITGSIRLDLVQDFRIKTSPMVNKLFFI